MSSPASGRRVITEPGSRSAVIDRTGADRPRAFFPPPETVTKPIYTSAADAEAAFYDALARADLEQMMSVWAEDEEVVCIHPGGPRIVGLAAVRDVWRQILAGGERLTVNIAHRVVTANTMMAMHSVFEQISVARDGRRSAPIVATNIYLRGTLGWRMVMHHASPAPDPADFGELSPRVVH